MAFVRRANSRVPPSAIVTLPDPSRQRQMVNKLRLTLVQYRSVTRSLPRPTVAQMTDFAEFISGAHSWYKHLPLLPPGRPIQLYIDSAAGMQLTTTPDGRVKAETRESDGFHYSWMTTAQYRAQFGYLAFSRDFGTAVALQSTDGMRAVGSDDEPGIFDPLSRAAFALPEEVLLGGRALISGVIHTLGTHPSMIRIETQRASRVKWPEESGGQCAWDAILARCKHIQEFPEPRKRLKREDMTEQELKEDLEFVDLQLYRLLGPERDRQKRGLVEAMTRIIGLLDG